MPNSEEKRCIDCGRSKRNKRIKWCRDRCDKCYKRSLKIRSDQLYAYCNGSSSPDLSRVEALLKNAKNIKPIVCSNIVCSKHGSEKRTPLHAASKNGYRDVCILILKYSVAGMDLLDKNGWAALHFATWQSQIEIVQLLLDKGCKSIDQPDNDGWTPLHLAARYASNAVQLLLEKGCKSIDQPKNDGWTPLHLAACYGPSTAVQLLLINGANSTLLTKYNNTALDLARERAHDAIVEMLKNPAQFRLSANANANHSTSTISDPVEADNQPSARVENAVVDNQEPVLGHPLLDLVSSDEETSRVKRVRVQYNLEQKELQEAQQRLDLLQDRLDGSQNRLNVLEDQLLNESDAEKKELLKAAVKRAEDALKRMEDFINQARDRVNDARKQRDLPQI